VIEVIRTCTVRAHKPHVCDYCGHVIPCGETYVQSCNKVDGELYTWLAHPHCDRIASAIWNYVAPSEGMDACTFRDAVKTVMREHYCPANCQRWVKDVGCSAGNDMTSCLRRFDEFMQTHSLRWLRPAGGIPYWALVPKTTDKEVG
jgi:hypothetical protein